MKADPNKSLQEIAVEVPGAIRALENCGLDYCQATRTSLKAACEERGLEIEGVLAQMEQGAFDAEESRVFAEWSARSLGDLIAHIVSRHHAFCWRELDRLARLLEEAAAVKNRHRRDVKRLQKLFSVFHQKLRQHMSFEEQAAFPYIAALERAAQGGEAVPASGFPTVQRPVRMMLLDHDAAVRLLRRVQAASADPRLRRCKTPSGHDLSSMMTKFEEELSSHIFLEDHILFPRAVNLERSESLPSRKTN